MTIVVIEPAAKKQFHALPVGIRIRIEKIFVRLSRWPEVSGAKPLSGKLAGHYRVRTGDYRVQFRVQPTEAVEEETAQTDEVIVEKIGHRDGFYED
jgi:mRNA-degrading endonuclease RelE of RelBE toxin-antitoxin system